MPTDAYLVIACIDGKEFPTYTITGCECPMDALETVLDMGFAFGGRNSRFTLKAVRVAVFDYQPQPRSSIASQS